MSHFLEQWLSCWLVAKFGSQLNSKYLGSMIATWTYLDFTFSSSWWPENLQSHLEGSQPISTTSILHWPYQSQFTQRTPLNYMRDLNALNFTLKFLMPYSVLVSQVEYLLSTYIWSQVEYFLIIDILEITNGQWGKIEVV